MTYKTYRNLPPLAGLCSMDDAQRPGLSVQECVTRLKRFHYCFKRIHEIFTARITAEPIYELKTAFSHHAYLCAEHATALRKRVGEMREPPLGLEDVPHEALALYFNEILCAPTTETLVYGLYAEAIPALSAACEKYLRETHKLADAPSIRALRFAMMELTDMGRFGEQALTSLVDEAKRTKLADCSKLLDECLAAAGGVDGTAVKTSQSPKPHYSAQPYKYDAVPKRDERFQDSYNAGVNPEAFLYDEQLRRARQDADDVLQANARDRRTRDDGQHHRRNAGKAVGLLPGDVAAALG